MPSDSFEIRTCIACGLRYPLVQGHTFGTRCPACMGETRLILRRQLVTEPNPARPDPHLPEDAKSHPMKEAYRGSLSVLLDNIRSAWNVGSILRSADGFGFTHAYCCGITPTPDNEAVAKTSLGAEDSVPWSYHKDAVRLVKGLKREGWGVFALEEAERAIPIGSAVQSPQRGILIVGNEVSGVDPDLLDLCDSVFHIPMHGEKKSFNVAIAFGIAAYALR